MIPSQSKLARIKRGQKAAFDALCDEFASIYDKLKAFDTSHFTTPLWKELNAELESALLPCPPFSFLRHPLITATMVITDFGQVLKQELSMLEREYPEGRLRMLLEEDYVGNPVVVNSRYLTSHNSIHHLYHMTRFLGRTKTSVTELRTIIEWGGGYGNFAKLFRRLHSAPHTFIIIDTPLFSSVQWLYLSTILGPDGVNLLQKPADGVRAGKINLIPLCFLDQQDLSADLFVSTWALSESSEYSQDYVAAREWFRSTHLLIGYQKGTADCLPAASRVGTLAREGGASIEEIGFLPSNYYAFR